MDDRVKQLLGHFVFALQVLMVAGQHLLLTLQRRVELSDALQSVDFGPQDGTLVRLGEEIVPAAHHALDQGLIVGYGSEKNDWHEACSGQCLDLARGLVAIHLRHHDVHQDHVWLLLLKEGHGFSTIFRHTHGVPIFLQHRTQDHTIGAIVVSNQNGKRG